MLITMDNISVAGSKGGNVANISHFTHHWSVHVPECSFLTVEDFPLNFVSFLINSVERNESQNCFYRACSLFRNMYNTPSHV